MNTINTIQVTQSDYNLLQELLARGRGVTPEEKARREALSRELARAQIIPASEIAPDVVTLRRRVRLTDLESGDVLEYTLVLPEEADVGAGRISILVPLGTAMLGFRRGDTFEWAMPGGAMRLRVERVTQG
jgi:regulator of nucleoside diphosphate kinase